MTRPQRFVFPSPALSMAAAGDYQPEKPFILVYRLPNFHFSFSDRLSQHFSVLDHVASNSSGSNSAADLRRFLGPRAAEIRVVLCHGPSPMDAEVLACLPSLECMVVSAAGVDHVDLTECRRRGITVANDGGAFSEDIADYAVGILIDVMRQVSVGGRHIRAKSWNELIDFPLGSKVGRKKVGIVGLGSIGSLVAKRLVGLGCKVAYKRKKMPSAPYTYYDNIHDLAQDSDVLVLCCALTDETRKIIDKDVMSALGEQGVIINIGSGALIDEKELVTFLVEGKLAGAGLDVFENEPHVPSELLGLDSVVMSPHRGHLTLESFRAAEDMVVANLEAFFSNKPLLSPVELE